MAMTPLQKAIEHAGSQAKLALKLGCSQQVICNWIRRGSVPPERCIDIERATLGAVRCEDLQPDVDWAYLRGTPTVDAEKHPIPDDREAA